MFRKPLLNEASGPGGRVGASVRTWPGSFVGPPCASAEAARAQLLIPESRMTCSCGHSRGHQRWAKGRFSTIVSGLWVSRWVEVVPSPLWMRRPKRGFLRHEPGCGLGNA